MAWHGMPPGAVLCLLQTTSPHLTAQASSTCISHIISHH
jgi:hypothetical protein